MDPHKRSVTIEVMDAEEQILGGGRLGTDVAGYRSMLDDVSCWPDRVWAMSARRARRLCAPFDGVRPIRLTK